MIEMLTIAQQGIHQWENKKLYEVKNVVERLLITLNQSCNLESLNEPFHKMYLEMLEKRIPQAWNKKIKMQSELEDFLDVSIFNVNGIVVVDKNTVIITNDSYTPNYKRTLRDGRLDLLLRLNPSLNT